MRYYYSHAYLTTPFCLKFSTLAPPEEIPSYATGERERVHCVYVACTLLVVTFALSPGS